MPVLFGGHILLPLVEIGLTYLPKSGTPSTPGTPGTPRDDRPALVSSQLGKALLDGGI